jgi:hypothetical protein
MRFGAKAPPGFHLTRSAAASHGSTPPAFLQALVFGKARGLFLVAAFSQNCWEKLICFMDDVEAVSCFYPQNTDIFNTRKRVLSRPLG